MESFSDVMDHLTLPLGIVLQVAMLAALVALVRLDWTRILARRKREEPA